MSRDQQLLAGLLLFLFLWSGESKAKPKPAAQPLPASDVREPTLQTRELTGTSVVFKQDTDYIAKLGLSAMESAFGAAAIVAQFKTLGFTDVEAFTTKDVPDDFPDRDPLTDPGITTMWGRATWDGEDTTMKVPSQIRRLWEVIDT